MGLFRRKVPSHLIRIHPDNATCKDWVVLLEAGQFCKRCDGRLMTNHPPFGLVEAFTATLPTLKFSPGVHVNYAETVLPMRDGVPKLRGFPKEFGGSGEGE
jgi:hypothetical protein